MGRIVAERRSRMKVFALSLALSSFLAVAAVLPGPAWTAEKGPASEALQPGQGSPETLAEDLIWRCPSGWHRIDSGPDPDRDLWCAPNSPPPA
jgi:hypothetical protein